MQAHGETCLFFFAKIYSRKYRNRKIQRGCTSHIIHALVLLPQQHRHQALLPVDRIPGPGKRRRQRGRIPAFPAGAGSLVTGRPSGVPHRFSRTGAHEDRRWYSAIVEAATHLTPDERADIAITASQWRDMPAVLHSRLIALSAPARQIPSCSSLGKTVFTYPAGPVRPKPWQCFP